MNFPHDPLKIDAVRDRQLPRSVFDRRPVYARWPDNTLVLPVGVGPHERRELILLLGKKKRVASVGLYLGQDFDRHVRSGRLIRHRVMLRRNPPAFSTYYALPQARTLLLRLLRLRYDKPVYDDERERRIGFILGYTARQVEVWIAWEKEIYRRWREAAKEISTSSEAA